MVGRQVDKVILFPSKQGSKCGKMDKKEMPDAEALTPPRPAFCLFVCEVEPLRRKVGVTHGVQLIGGLAGQRRHFLVHVRQSCPEICRRPAAVGVVVQTDQVFSLPSFRWGLSLQRIVTTGSAAGFCAICRWALATAISLSISLFTKESIWPFCSS